MKVILINGSPRKEGCTFTALSEIKKTLVEEGIDAEIFQIGTDIVGCRACRACSKIGKCVSDDKVNEFTALANDADGFIFGSPVHFAAVSGLIKSFLDRAFFSGKSAFLFKPAACVLSARRGGTTAAFDQLNKYFTISQMPVISSRYWNMVHGSNPEDVVKDEEGMQTMRGIADNMAWLLNKIHSGEGLDYPEREPWNPMNFIR